MARGSIINSVFLVGIGLLNLLKALIAAAFLTQAEFGIWIILYLAVVLLIGLKGAAVSDKYIQQDETDQEVAFQKSFTLELMSAAILIVLSLGLAPVLALAYDNSDLILPMIALSVMLAGLAMQAPIWVFRRRMDFMRQRLYMAVDPIVSFVVTIGLAVAGVGYWSLVAGSVAGALVGGIVAVLASPIPLRLRYERDTTRAYVSFSWPLVVAVGSALAIAHVSVFVGNAAIGLAASGAIGLAATFSAYGDRVDTVITQAMYPAICRVADRRDTLLEAFEVSNRLALMWAVPFGAGLSLFAQDLIDVVLGAQWQSALILFQVFGITAALNHIGFNWGAFYRAIGETKPVAVVTFAAFVAFMTSAVPLTFAMGLDGFAIGMGAVTVVTLVFRGYYVVKLFPGFRLIRYAARALLPSIPPVLFILGLRLFVEDGTRTGALIAAELTMYALLTVVAAVWLERNLLREAAGYLREAPGPGTGDGLLGGPLI